LEFACFVYFRAAVALEFSNFNAEWVVEDAIFVWDSFKGQVEVDYVVSGNDLVGLLVALLNFLG
jgi:hypothetical protein